MRRTLAFAAAVLLIPTAAGLTLSEVTPPAEPEPATMELSLPMAGGLEPSARVTPPPPCVLADVPFLVDECGDTMLGDLTMQANVIAGPGFGVDFPAGPLRGETMLTFNGAAACLANFAPPACGDLTGVSAGSGLLGGCLSGDVALAVDRTSVQSRVTGSCPTNNYVRIVNQDGTVVCGLDGNTLYLAGAGLVLTGNVFSLAAPTGSLLGGVFASTCAGTAKVTGVTPTGALSCGADVDTNSGGTVTSVASGAGLTGGPITGAGALSIAAGGVTSAMIADGTVGSADVDSAQVQLRISGACPNGSAVDSITPAGSVTCENLWSRAGNAGTTPGTHFLGTTDNVAFEIKVNNKRAFRIEPQPGLDPGTSNPNIIGGDSGNGVTAGVSAATIAGGGAGPTLVNTVTGSYGTVSGGIGNRAGLNAAVGGGFRNLADGAGSTVSGGVRNWAGSQAAVGGGSDNSADGTGSTVSGGFLNRAAGLHAAVGGGLQNSADGTGSTVPGGLANRATATATFAAGLGASADHVGSFVWADANTDGSGLGFASNAAQSFSARARGGFRMFVSASNAGCTMTAASPTWTCTSDVNLKDDLQPVDSAKVLAKVAALPVATWSMKGSPGVLHMGPMAQDFRAAFGLGETDRGIGSVDADGVAFAAIQGLYQELQQEKARNRDLEARLAALEARLG